MISASAPGYAADGTGRSILIVGSGPAATGAALAAARHPEVRVTVIDLGGRLEPWREAVRDRLATMPPSAWDAQDVGEVSRQPIESATRGLPQKLSFASDYPFRDFGQLSGVTALDGVNPAVISGAYGGFSTVWGTQIMPFTQETFRGWPVDSAEMYASYTQILREIPYAAEEDDLADLFPLLAAATPLPKVSDRTDAVLSRYSKHRLRLRRSGVTLGRARLAFAAADCVRCGLCMTGCPYSLLYSASQTLDRLRAQNRITYHDRLLALAIEEEGDKATVVVKELDSGRLQRLAADRVVVACGAIGSSRLVMGSLGLFDTPARVSEASQFVLPFLSRMPVVDPRGAQDFTLNQFNMAVDLSHNRHDISLLHFYTYNSAFLDALPSLLRRHRAEPLRRQLLRRLSVAFGYLPSWVSPSFQLRAHPPRSADSLPQLSLAGSELPSQPNPALRGVLRRLSAAAPYLDLWPLLPMLQTPASGKSYHWGATFPHADSPSGRFTSDTLGRVAPWTRVHLADASVFPTVPATTFTLTIMANAHRIVSSVLTHLD
jgi:ferredoxin